MNYESINPATGESLYRFATHSNEELATLIDSAERGATRWRQTPIHERAALLFRCAENLEKNIIEYSGLITREMGKPQIQARAEIEKSALVCRHYAQYGEEYLSEISLPDIATKCVVRHEPLGIVLAVMPWNFPFWQIFRFLTAALVAGNTVIVKHAPGVCGCAEAIEKLMVEVGDGCHVYTNLRIDERQISTLIADQRVRAVTFTGSTVTGRIIGRLAGEALKPCVLELGGSDPFIVLPDADLSTVVPRAVAARIVNSGQSCIAAKRFLIHHSVYKEFEDRFFEELCTATLGDPMRKETRIGPLASAKQKRLYDSQCDDFRRAGASLRTSTQALPSVGAYGIPGIVTDLDPNHPLAKIEVFGPAALLFVYTKEEELVGIANGTPYGLSASLWGRDWEQLDILTRRLDVGAIFINRTPASDPRFPFGGVKESGFGRELGRDGALAFVNRKSVVSD